MNDNQRQAFLGVNLYDGKFVNKTGLGCGCDITETIGEQNCKTQLLDFARLRECAGIEIDPYEKCVRTIITGSNYREMTNNMNASLVGRIGASFMNIAFGRTLNFATKRSEKQIDIYEYGMNLLIRKMYALNIKPELLCNLREFISEKAWEEINATNMTDRTNKDKIKELFKKYGTHITTKAFYGCMYQYILYREQNYWESNIGTQVAIGSNAKVPVPDTGVTVEGEIKEDFSSNDKNCYQNATKVEVINHVGGNTALTDEKEWVNSCTLEEPKSCAMLGYCFNGGPNADSGLIPLYYLLDQADERKNAMREALEEYMDDNSIEIQNSELVIVDAYAKHFPQGGADEIRYRDENDRKCGKKYFRLNENVFNHVRGCTKGEFYFYYALGHLVDEAVVDMKFEHKDDINGDWEIRGNKANDGVTGSLKNRHLAIRKANVRTARSEDFVTGFGVRVDGSVKSISKGTDTKFDWKENSESEVWYKGLVHDDVECVTTKKKLKPFF